MKWKLICLSGIFCFILTSALVGIVQSSFSQSMKLPPVQQMPDISQIKRKKYQQDTTKTRQERREIVSQVEEQFEITDSNTQARKDIIGVQKYNRDGLIDINSMSDSLLRMVDIKESKVPQFIILPDVKPNIDTSKPQLNNQSVDPEKVPVVRKKKWLKIFLK